MRKERRNKTTRKTRERVRRGNQDDARKLRGELLEAAMQLFSGHGLEGVSMRAIAQKVGVSPMAPYRYFANKADLLIGLWQFVMQALYDRVNEAISAQGNARERVRALVDSFIGYWEENPDCYRLVYMTEQTTQQGKNSAFAAAPIYGQLRDLGLEVTQELAEDIAAGPNHVKLATDIRMAMQLGFLHGTLITRRYPWSDHSLLRAAYIEQTIAAVERCLLHGPPQARPELPSRRGNRASVASPVEDSSGRA